MRCEFLRHFWWGVRWHACFQGKALLYVYVSSSARMLFEIRIKSTYLYPLKGARMSLLWNLKKQTKKKTSRILFFFFFFAETSLLLYIINIYQCFVLYLFYSILFWWTCFFIPFYDSPRVLSNFSKVIISSFRLWKCSHYSIQHCVKTAF